MKSCEKTLDNYTNIVYNTGMKSKKERHNIAISKEIWQLAEKKAKELGLSVSAYISMLIKKS